MLDTWIEFGNCYLLVYAIDDLDSFKQIKHKYDRICQVKNNEKFSVVIVGNKCDLSDSKRKITIVLWLGRLVAGHSQCTLTTTEGISTMHIRRYL